MTTPEPGTSEPIPDTATPVPVTPDAISPEPSTPAPSIPRGWYPDPRDTTNQRYFDGKQWTPHVEPRQDLPPPKGDIFAPLRRVLPLAAVVLVVVVTGFTVIVPMLNRSDPTVFPTITVGESPAPQEEQAADEMRTDCGGFTAGETIEGQIEQDEKCAFTMAVAEAGLLVVDARPADGVTIDLTLQAFGADAEQRAGNDDRGALTAVGGDVYDPILVLDAPEGSYEIAVGSFAGLEAGAFVLTTYYAEDVDQEHSDEVVFGADDVALTRALVVEEAGEFTLEASSDDGVFAMVIDTVSGELNLFEALGDETLVEQVSLEPGRHLLVLSRQAQSAGELTYSIGPV